jgi:hypothetical protein
MPGIHGEICTFYSSLPLDANWTSTSASNVVKMSVTLVDDAGSNILRKLLIRKIARIL